MVKKYEKTIKERFPEIAPIVLKWGNLEKILKVKNRTELQEEVNTSVKKNPAKNNPLLPNEYNKDKSKVDQLENNKK